MRKRVLLVEEDHAAAAAVSGVLSSAGYQVETVDSPFGVACTFRRFKPHVILLDLNMAGLNAPMFIGLLTARKYDFDYGIVVHSSPDNDALKRTVCLKGVCGYIPVDASGDELLHCIRCHCENIHAACSVRVPLPGNMVRSPEELTVQ